LKRDDPVQKDEVHWFSPVPVQVSTDEPGRFEANGLQPGTVPVQVYARGYAIWRSEVECPAFATSELQVCLQRGGSLEGRVLDSNGKPARAEIEIPAVIHAALAHAVSDERGVFRIDDGSVSEKQSPERGARANVRPSD
jgi:hypothetical protein